MVKINTPCNILQGIAPDQNRTDTRSLEGYCSTIELQARLRELLCRALEFISSELYSLAMSIDRNNLNISLKANRVLNVILVALILIALRIWHLEVIQYEEKLEDSRKPQRRTVIEPAKRATIRDRFGVPLAINKIQYSATILYSQLRQIPSVTWEKDSNGKRIKKFNRKNYITRLSHLLGEELNLDPAKVEDLIHAKASLYYNIPFVLKEDLSEKEYYRLKMMEKDWQGIQVQRRPKRVYPLGKTAGDIVGYMGAISKKEYETILAEMRALRNFLEACEGDCVEELPPGISTEAEARKRLKDLQEHAYTIADYVGKAGIEGRFEQELRGYHGKRVFYSDARGNYLKELPGSREPLSGRRLSLTLSVELQQFAEQLLAQNERIRIGKASTLDNAKQVLFGLRQPWMKGGSILALDPQTGEILAMASYPRFDPNDFILLGNSEAVRQKRSNIARWFETESYLADLWDQKRVLEREYFNDQENVFYEDKQKLDLATYLAMILPKGSAVTNALNKLATVKGAIDYQTKEEVDKDPSYERILLSDLCRLLVDKGRFDEELIRKVGNQPLTTYRNDCASKVSLAEVTKGMARELFDDLDFKLWRLENEKNFLKDMRNLEKRDKRPTKPYTDYLEAKENTLFDQFWEENGNQILLTFLRGDNFHLKPYESHFKKWHQELTEGAHSALPWHGAYETLQAGISAFDHATALRYLATLRGYRDLIRPLKGKYKGVRKEKGMQFEKHLATAFYPLQGFGYGRSQTFRQATSQGSIFKLVTAYAALAHRYQILNEPAASLKKLNPLEIVDHTHKKGKEIFIGTTLEGKPIPRMYKGGRLPRSTHAIGKVDLLKALEHSSNPYFSLLASDYLSKPEDLADAARLFSYGAKTGIDLPAEISGNVPADLNRNPTGLYSMAIGQHTLVVTPLQTGTMLSTIANGGHLLKPQIVKQVAGHRPNRKEDDEASEDLFPYQEDLASLGIDFPLILPLSDGKEEAITDYSLLSKKEIFLPQQIRSMLLEGMRRVMYRTLQESLLSLSRFYTDYPEAISDLIEMKKELIGKTSTAESVEHLDLDPKTGTNLYTHVWFGGISFQPREFILKDKFGRPELVVVIYLRYGDYGKEAAPLAAQIVKKWREIQRLRM